MLLSLRNVSKFYYSKGVVTSGFSKVSLDLDRGEFVAITGESGSGKSTLLNVISGLDSYEEGELLINGEETSAYTENEFEQYRRRYIANVFQSFNLISSYTVYQNVALILMINGEKRPEVRRKVEDAIRKVGLWEYRKAKASKLSGGQKQRVAIARALVKETPIIVADEPTGNLDAESAGEIMKLFSEVAKDKLVIIVTHNYEQVAPYVTRKIRMSDGRIVENELLAQAPEAAAPEPSSRRRPLSMGNQLRLGFRNTFNILPKFILLLIVFAFMTVSVLSMYASYRKSKYDSSNVGWSQYFSDVSDSRLIIRKEDRSVITDEDFAAIAKLDNLGHVVRNDILADTQFSIMDAQGSMGFAGLVKDTSQFQGHLVAGRMPESEHEIVIDFSKDDYYLSQIDSLLNLEYSVTNNFSGDPALTYPLTVVGVSDSRGLSVNTQCDFYAGASVLNDLLVNTYVNASTLETLFQNTYLASQPYSTYYLTTNVYVPVGQAYIPDALSYLCKDNKCTGLGLTINSKNLYYSRSQALAVGAQYDETNIKKYLGLSKDQTSYGYIYVNPVDYAALFSNDTYQASVYVRDAKKYQAAKEALEAMGYKVLHVKDTLYSYSDVSIIATMFQTFLIVLVLGALFFISYFIIRIIFRSRNTYFTTLRMLGATKSNAKHLLYIELFLDLDIAFAAVCLTAWLVLSGRIQLESWKSSLAYLNLNDYLILYGLLAVMCALIARRYSKQIFKTSAISAFRERD